MHSTAQKFAGTVAKAAINTIAYLFLYCKPTRTFLRMELRIRVSVHMTVFMPKNLLSKHS